MLEEPLKILKGVSDDLMKLIGEDAQKEFDERKKSKEKTIAAFNRIIDNAKNPPEIRLMVANLIKLESDITLIISENNYVTSLIGLSFAGTEHALAVIDNELTQLKKPAKQTTEDVERIKLLEENTANLKKQLETMKPLFAKVKKDVAARKKYLNENR